MEQTTAQTMEPAQTTGAAATSCPLCSANFDMVSNCHDGCPMSNGCSLVRCPHCGFEFPDPGRSRLASLLTRWFGPKQGSDKGETR